MKRIHLGIVLLAAAPVVVGGWAFREVLKPANLLQVLQAFSMC
jgi:hypothetical protein